jgi:hypothetical protein
MGLKMSDTVGQIKQELQYALDDIVKLRAEIRDEVLKIEEDMKRFPGSKDHQIACHKKKTYQSMGLSFAEAILRKWIDTL